MDNQFYEQARKNILRRRKEDAGQELRNAIDHEATCLKYQSEKLMVTVEIESEFKILERKMKAVPVQCRFDAYAQNGFFNAISEIKKEGRYHPEVLGRLRSRARKQRWMG